MAVQAGDFTAALAAVVDAACMLVNASSDASAARATASAFVEVAVAATVAEKMQTLAPLTLVGAMEMRGVSLDTGVATELLQAQRAACTALQVRRRRPT